MFGIDDALLGGLVSGGISAIGGLFQQFSANSQAQQAEQFQKSQTDTAYQRSVADLKAAGLNPIIAAFNGGANSAAGQVAPQVNVGEAATRGFSQGVSSAKDSMTAKATVDNIVASSQQSRASAAANLASAKLASINADTAAKTQSAAIEKAISDAGTASNTFDATLPDAKRGLAQAQLYSSPGGKLLAQVAAGGRDVSSATSAVGNITGGVKDVAHIGTFGY